MSAHQVARLAAPPRPSAIEEPIAKLRLLTLHAIDAIGREDLDDFRELISERERVLTEIEALPITDAAIDALAEAQRLEARLIERLTSVRRGTLEQLVRFYRDRRNAQHYHT